MTDEEIGISVVRAVIGVGDNELRVRQVLLQDERVHRVDDHVVAAVDDQRRLLDELSDSHRDVRAARPIWRAARCAGATFSLTSGSRSFDAKPKRFRNSRPAAWLATTA